MNSFNVTLRLARRIAVFSIGVTILLIGGVMIVMPGPAIIVIPIGLAVLGLEFAWARVWLKRLRERISAGNSKRQSDKVEKHRERQSRM